MLKFSAVTYSEFATPIGLAGNHRFVSSFCSYNAPICSFHKTINDSIYANSLQWSETLNTNQAITTYFLHRYAHDAVFFWISETKSCLFPTEPNFGYGRIENIVNKHNTTW